MKNSRREYFDILTKDGEDVDRYLEEYYEEKIFPNFPEKREIIRGMLERKKGKQKLRATATHLAVCAFIGYSYDEELIRIKSAIELLNWSTYHENWVIDGKNNGDKDARKRENVLGIIGFYNDAINIVAENRDKGIDYVLTLKDIQERVLRGFEAERHLSLENEQILKNKKLFEKYYNIRNDDAVGYFFDGCVKIARIYSDGDKKLEEKLRSVYRDFGRGSEILNDLSDFVITTDNPISHEKIRADQFSDLRTDTVTLPIWLMYNKSSEKDREFLKHLKGKRIIDKPESKKVLGIFYSTGAYEETKSEIIHLYTRIRKNLREVDIVPHIKSLLGSMISSLSSNRFYHNLKNNYIWR